MSVGHDVAGGIHNHSRTYGILADDKCGLRFIFLAERSISSDENLHNRGRDLGGQALQSAVELY
jgi:hypothetical protein